MVDCLIIQYDSFNERRLLVSRYKARGYSVEDIWDNKALCLSRKSHIINGHATVLDRIYQKYKRNRRINKI